MSSSKPTGHPPAIDSNQDLRKADLIGADLSGVDLSKRDRSNARLFKADLRGAALGGQLAKAWDFPDSLSDAIAAHHQQGVTDLPLSARIAALVKNPGNEDDSKEIIEKAQQLPGVDSSLSIELLNSILQQSRDLAGDLS